MKFRRNLEEIQTKFRRNLEEIRTDIKTKFRQNLDIPWKIQSNLACVLNSSKFRTPRFTDDVVEEALQQVDQADQADAVDIKPAPVAEDGASGSPAKAAKEPDVEATPSPAR